MDDIDRASELEEARILRGLGAISKEMSDHNEDIECIDCGEEIEEERRAVLPSAKRCVQCQQLHEKTSRVRRY